MARRVIGTAVVQVKADTNQFRTALNGLTGGVGSAFSKISRLVGAIGLGHLAKEAVTFGATYRIQLDNARAAIQGLVGSQSEADDLMERMTKFAIQTPFTLPGVTDATTRMLALGQGFGVTSANVIDYVDILGNAAAATGKTTDNINNVINIMGRISGQNRIMGRDMTQLNQNFPSLKPWTTLSELTGQTEASLRKLALQKGGLTGVVDTSKFINALVEDMKTLPGASANWEQLAKSTGKTVDQLKALSDEDLAVVFAEFPESADAMTRKMNTLGGSVELFHDTIGVALADGLVPFFAAIQQGMNSQVIGEGLAKVIASFSALATGIVTGVMPVLPGLIAAFDGVLKALMPLAPVVGIVLKIFGDMLVTLTPLISTVALFVGWIADLLSALDPALLGAIAAGVLLLWLSFTGGAFALMPIVIALVIAVATLIRQHWDEITEITGKMVDKIVAAWQWLYDNVIGPVANFVGAVIDFFQNLYDVLVGNSIIPDLVNAIVNWFNILKNFVVAIFNALKAAVIAVWNGIKTAVTTVVNAVVTVVTTTFNALKTTVTSIWNTIKSTASTVWNAIKTAVTTPIEAAHDVAKAAVQAILDKVRSAWSGLSGFVSGVWNAIKNAITGPIQAAYDFVAEKIAAIGRLVQGAIDAVSHIPGAGVVGSVVGFFTGANGGIEDFGSGTPAVLHGREAVIPLSNPMRAMQLMQQAGLDRLATTMGGGFSGPLVSMPGAVIQDATDADLVAQRTLVAMQGAMVA